MKPETAWTIQTECTGQGHGALVPEAQGSGSLALPYVGLVDALEERRADGTALAGTLDHKQATVDPAGLGHQLGQVADPVVDPDVAWLVDHGLDASALPSFKYCLTRLCL